MRFPASRVGSNLPTQKIQEKCEHEGAVSNALGMYELIENNHYRNLQ